MKCCIKYCNYQPCGKQRPTKQGKQLQKSAHPGLAENIRTHAIHHTKKLSNCAVYGVEQPLQHHVPDGFRNGSPYIGKLIAHPRQCIADPIKHRPHSILLVFLPPITAASCSHTAGWNGNKNSGISVWFSENTITAAHFFCMHFNTPLIDIT